MSKKIGCVGHDCEKCQSEKVNKFNWSLVYLHDAMEYIRENYTQVYSECGDCEEFRADRIKEIEQSAQHPDDAAVDRFATAMKAKMAKQRAKGYGGWNDKAVCSTERLQAMLEDHLSKGDPVDVGNFAMMLWNRGEQTAVRQTVQGEPVAPDGKHWEPEITKVWDQVQVCTWIGNQLMNDPSMFERGEVCKFVRSLGRSEILAKHYPSTTQPAPVQQEPVDISQMAVSHGLTWSGTLGVWKAKHHQIKAFFESARTNTSPQPAQQEPVGEWGDGRSEAKRILWKPGYVVSAKVGDKLYASPPAQRKPLTDEEIGHHPFFRAGVRFAEATHGIKENT